MWRIIVAIKSIVNKLWCCRQLRLITYCEEMENSCRNWKVSSTLEKGKAKWFLHVFDYCKGCPSTSPQRDHSSAKVHFRQFQNALVKDLCWNELFRSFLSWKLLVTNWGSFKRKRELNNLLIRLNCDSKCPQWEIENEKGS